jgi:N utilization substance protein A
MVTTATINVHELMQVADVVAREKSVDKNIVIEALEEAITRSAKACYGTEYDIRVTIHPKTGSIDIFRYRELVEVPENNALQVSVSEAQERDSALTLGDFLIDPLPPVEIGRISAQAARQVIIQKIREAERDAQYEAYKDRVGEIIYGSIKRIEFGNVMVDLGEFGEGIIRRNEVIPRENMRVGDRIRSYLYDVRRENSGPQVFLSRTHPQFMVKLFASEVPEVYEGIIEIRAVARDPGSRAKIAVYTDDSSIDPVGSCVGLRGGRVQAVTNELQGERIDIINWSPDAATLIMNALSPVPVLRVVVDEDEDKVEVVVPDEMSSQVIGRRGQNVRLLSQLLGWNVDVLTETSSDEKRQQEFANRTELFIEALDVDQMLAQFLITEGFESVEDVAYCDVSEIAEIEGLDETLASELQERAFVYLEKKKILLLAQGGSDKRLQEIDGLTIDILFELMKNDIKLLEDFAGLTADELITIAEDDAEINTEINAEINPETAIDEIEASPELDKISDDAILSGFNLDEVTINRMIMEARKLAGWLD